MICKYKLNAGRNIIFVKMKVKLIMMHRRILLQLVNQIIAMIN